MDALGNQLERKYYRVSREELDAFLEGASNLAKKYGESLESVIDAKRVLEMKRQNNIVVQSGDYTDEQVGGFWRYFISYGKSIRRKRVGVLLWMVNL